MGWQLGARCVSDSLTLVNAMCQHGMRDAGEINRVQVLLLCICYGFETSISQYATKKCGHPRNNFKEIVTEWPHIAPLFIREDGYWENHMLPYLEAEGWKVIVVDCAGVKTTLDFAYRLVESIESVYAIPDDFNLRWASEDACLINWFDMRQGFFVLYKNFDDLFVMDDEDVSLCVNIIEQMDTRYTVRPIHGSGLYQVLFGWGFEISQESLPRVKEFFEGKVMFAMDGVKYPWSRVERFKKVFFPQGFPDPLYEDGEWIDDPDEYPESTTYTGGSGEEGSSE